MWKDMLADVIGQTLDGFRQEFAEFGPRLLAMTIVLVVGVVFAALLRVVLRALLRRLGFDRFAERAGLPHALGKFGFTRQASGAVAAVTAFVVLAFFVLLALGSLDPLFARELVSRALAYLPQVLVAAALIALGAIVAGFVRRGVLIAAVNRGLPSARLLAGFAQSALLILFAGDGARAPRGRSPDHPGLVHDPVRRRRLRALAGVRPRRPRPRPRAAGAAGAQGREPREDPLRHI
jgi:hypothetical protein